VSGLGRPSGLATGLAPGGGRVKGARAIAYTVGVTLQSAEERLRGAWLGVTLGVVVLLQLVVVNFWPRFESPNERGRVYQALAVVTRGTLEISPEVERFGGMEDLASAGGRIFPNKAPGMLPLLLPGAFLAERLAGNDPESTLRLALVLGRLLAAGAPFVLTVLLLARVASVRSPAGGAVIVAAFALATPALAAALLLFSHALTACLLLAAYLLLFGSRRAGVRCGFLAGVLLAWASVSEYPVALPAAVLALAAVHRLGRWGSFGMTAGGALPLILLGLYNASCFGSPFALASAHSSYGSFAALGAQGLSGVSWPRASALVGLLVSPSRGLLVWAPVAALALVGVLRRGAWWREDIAARLALVAAPAVLLIAMSGYRNWHGGWFPGPRYLLAVLPLICLLAADGAETVLRRGWGRALVALGALWGWLQVWPVLASFPFPPEDYPVPFVTLAQKLLGGGIRVPSWLPPPLLQPVLGVLGAAAMALLLLLATPGGRPVEWLVALVLLLGALLLVGNVRPPSTWQSSLELAVIHDVYAGGPKGTLEELLPRADTPDRRAKLESWIAVRDGTPGR
jgi:hypothetical protein